MSAVKKVVDNKEKQQTKAPVTSPTSPQTSIQPTKQPTEEKNCNLQCEFINRNSILAEIHHTSSQKISEFVDQMNGLTLVDVGGGCGCTMGTICSLLQGQFDHIVSYEPHPEYIKCTQNDNNHLVPLHITRSELIDRLKRHNLFNNLGVLLCYPYCAETPKEDYQALLELQPKAMVIYVGYIYEYNEEHKQLHMQTTSGSTDLWNQFLGPLRKKTKRGKYKKVQLGSACYKTIKHVTTCITNGKHTLFGDDTSKVKFEKEKNIYYELFFLGQVGCKHKPITLSAVSSYPFPQGLGLNNRGAYNSTTTYTLNDFVFYPATGSSYISLTSNNKNNEPDTSPASWQLLEHDSLASTVSSSTSIADSH
jgi:hypothetical protein